MRKLESDKPHWFSLPVKMLIEFFKFTKFQKILTLRNNFCNEIYLQGLLDLEGDLTPILVSLVKSNNYATGMLDTPAKVEASLSRYVNYM